MDLWQHAQQLFDAALQHPPDKRQEFLEQACGANQELRREVESLLAAHDASGTFMAEPALARLEEILQPATRRFQPGDTVGVYKVLDLVGCGGMGEVYRAEHTRLKREVAIKVLPQTFAADRERLRRFEQEARAAAALNHPNIVAVHDLGTADGSPYLVSELLDGKNLAEVLREGPVPVRKALEYAIQAARGLAAAHDAGIIHRDLKPANLFITTDGQVKILDFGLAKLMRSDERGSESETSEVAPQTEVGRVLGTRGYMSPEQVRGQAADRRSDIFSFGCILYELFSGTRAFGGDSPADTLSAILHQDPPALTNTAPPVPAGIDRTIRHCLEKNPLERFQSAHDLVFQLVTATEGLSAVTRRWPVAAAIVVVAVAIAGGGWWAVTHQPRAAPVATTKAADDPRRLLAVLPFENITRDGKTGYFGAGMTEEVAGHLSKLSALRVVGRAAVAKFKDVRSDLSVMVQDLGIGSVVTGTVREDGPRLRVNVELMDARSGQVIWSEQYDRAATDVFAVQSDIALRVADALQASVTLDEQARIGKRPTSSVAAYQLFVRARNMRTSFRDQLDASLDLLRQAVALDPQFALAYSEMADRHSHAAALGELAAIPRGLDAAHKALAIDPQLAAAHHALASNLYEMGRLREALPADRKAVELDPSYVGGLDDLSIDEEAQGRLDESLTHASQALKLAPNVDSSYYHVGDRLVQLNADSQAERFLTAAAARFPTYFRLSMLLAQVDLRRGRPEAALDRIRRAVDRAPDNIEALISRAEIATLVGAADAPSLVRSLLADNAEGHGALTPYTIRFMHAYHLHVSGQAAQAAAQMNEILDENQKAITGGVDWYLPFMQNAAIHALRVESSNALDWLDRAYAAGWRDGRTLAIDPMFASVRKEPRFTELLSRIEADVTAMRARADYSGLGLK